MTRLCQVSERATSRPTTRVVNDSPLLQRAVVTRPLIQNEDRRSRYNDGQDDWETNLSSLGLGARDMSMQGGSYPGLWLMSGVKPRGDGEL